MYLVDTDVISAGAPRRGAAAAAALVRWMDERSGSLHISAVTVAEVEGGIAKARRESARRKAADQTGWLEALLHLYASHMARSRGVAPGFADVAIAATATRHGLTVLTRNMRHFGPMGVLALNPFDRIPIGR